MSLDEHICMDGWDARMDAARKVEIEKLLYAALVSADTTRDWPNCSRV